MYCIVSYAVEGDSMECKPWNGMEQRGQAFRRRKWSLHTTTQSSLYFQELLDKTERVYQQRAIDYAAGNPLEHLSAKLWRPYLTVAFLLSNGIKPIVGHASYKSIWGVLSFDFNNDSHREMMVRIEDVCNPWCGEQSPGHVVSDILHFQHYQEISTRQASRAGPVRCACCTKHDRQDVDAPKPIVAYVLVVKKMPWGARDTTTQTKVWAYQIIPQYLCSSCKVRVDTLLYRGDWHTLLHQGNC